MVLSRSAPNLLYVAVPHLAYFAIRFGDIPDDWQIGGHCICCGHTGPVGVSRAHLERRVSGPLSKLGRYDHLLGCTRCHNVLENTFTVTGRVRRWRVFPSGRTLRGILPLDASPAPARALRLQFGRASLIAAGWSPTRYSP